jgi:hypothetical protein
LIFQVGAEDAEAAAEELRKELACLKQSSIEGKLSREREVADLQKALSELENGRGALRAQVMLQGLGFRV